MKLVRMIPITVALIAVLSASASVMASSVDYTIPAMVHAETTKTPPSQSDANNQKVALAIANAFQVPVADVLALRDKNMGYGEIVIAYALAQKSGKPVNAIIALRTSGQGWGEISKTLLPDHTKLTKLGQLMRGKETANTGAPGKSGEHRQDGVKGKSDDTSEDDKDSDQAKDKGNSQGKGK